MPKISCKTLIRNLVTLTAVVCAASALAQQAGGTATDANAKHDSASPRKVPNRSAWVADCIYCDVPHYPLDARRRLAAGKGYYRVTFDMKTGTVEKVTVMQSTGVGSLDNSAIAALRKWRMKPGKWKEIVVPIDFRMGFRYPHH